MEKIKLEIAYDGTDFHGFAKQQGLRTVQGTLEAVLERITGRPVEVFGSGRTDAGVHARAQIVHFVQHHGPPVEKYPYVLRRVLPRDIVLVNAEKAAPSFHARFSVERKTYRYTVQRAEVQDVFTNRFSWHVPGTLWVERMRVAATYLTGEHDFTSFCAASTSVKDKNRTIFNLNIEEQGTFLHIHCTGSGFLQHMVRIIVGTLIDIGQERFSPNDILHMLKTLDRRVAGRTAPPHGLCLWEIVYPENLLLDLT